MDEELVTACYEGDVEGATRAMRKGARDFDQGLYQAAKRGNSLLVDLLIGWGAKALEKALRGAASGGQWEMCKVLIKRGASELDLALKEAAFSGELEVLENLLGQGARDLDGGLEGALLGKKWEVAEFLVSRGARVTSGGLLAAFLWGERLDWVLSLEILDFEFALRGMARRGDLGKVKILLEKGAKDIPRALQAASEGDQMEMALFLLNHLKEGEGNPLLVRLLKGL